MRKSSSNNWLKATAIFLVIVVFAAPLLSQEGTTAFSRGKLDGEKAAKGDPVVWSLAGAGCGCFGLLGAYLITPNPPASNLLGKSPEYVLGYTKAYKDESRKKNLRYAFIGCLANVVLTGLLSNL